MTHNIKKRRFVWLSLLCVVLVLIAVLLIRFFPLLLFIVNEKIYESKHRWDTAIQSELPSCYEDFETIQPFFSNLCENVGETVDSYWIEQLSTDDSTSDMLQLRDRDTVTELPKDVQNALMHINASLFDNDRITFVVVGKNFFRLQLGDETTPYLLLWTTERPDKVLHTDNMHSKKIIDDWYQISWYQATI